MTSAVTSAVVTGAGSGIGRACAQRLAGDGYRLVLVDRAADAAAAVAAEIRDADGDAVVVGGDVADRSTHEDAVAAATGRLEVWVNNAGIGGTEPLHDAGADLVGRILGVNAVGSYWGCAAALADFVEHRTAGRIVNISSIHAHRGFVDRAAYDMSKAAVEALTRNVAVTYGPYGIRANSVAPGAVMTPSLATVTGDPPTSDHGRLLLSGTPARRIARPEEIADVVAFLVSPAASYVSGQALGVDGGWQAQPLTQALDAELAARYGLDPVTGLPAGD